MAEKKDLTMDAIRLSIESGEFCQKAAEYLNGILLEDQKYIGDVIICTARLSHLAAAEARDAYSGDEDELQAEDRIHEYYKQLNDWREKLGYLKGKMEENDS